MKTTTTKRRRILELSPEKVQASKERKEKLTTLAKEVKGMTKVSQQIENDKLGFIMSISGKPLSLFNSCFVRRQRPAATTVGGFNQWKKAGRKVKKGSKAIAIWLPVKKDVPETEVQPQGDDDLGIRFFLVNVFDIADTEAAEG